MANGLQALINLSGTVCSNVAGDDCRALIQRELWTFRLDESRRDEFRKAGARISDPGGSDAEQVMVPLESEFEFQDQITAGLGFYYFEEDPDT